MEEEDDHKKEEGGGEGLPTRTDHECELSQMQEEVRGLMVLGWRQQKSGVQGEREAEARRRWQCTGSTTRLYDGEEEEEVSSS